MVKKDSMVEIKLFILLVQFKLSITMMPKIFPVYRQTSHKRS